MKSFILSLLFFHSAQASTHLLLIGGGARPTEAMNAFVQAAGGTQSHILVCSWASATTEGAQNIQSELIAAHAGKVEILPAFPMKSEDESKLLNLIRNATGIFFAGGDQNQLMLAMKTEKLKDAFKTAYQNGTAFAGTSAGTAIMSERMITGDAKSPSEAPELSEGLGLLPSEIIVDQHFLVRQRFNRLATLVMAFPGTYGLGVDEGTSLFITDGKIAHVIGPSQVLLFSKGNDQEVNVKYFKTNESFNLFNPKVLRGADREEQ